VAIKISLKKLDLHSPYEEFMKKGIDCKLLWATIIAGTEIQPDDSCGGLDHHPFDRLLHGLGTTSSGESRRQAVISHAPIHKLASVSLFKPEHLSQFPETAGLSSWCPVCS
jgi:hypothetical protein